MTDNVPGSPAPASRAMGSLVAGVKQAVVWLGGSLAGITAIFFASGYLITRAHLNMLGLYGVINFDTEDIVQEGGRFFLVLAYSNVIDVVLPLFVYLVALVIAARALWLLAGSRARRWWEPVGSRLPGFGPHGWMRLLAFGLLFAAFVWHYETYFSKFQAPLCIVNLLYADPGLAPCPAQMMETGAGQLKKALLDRQTEILNQTFQDLVVGFALAVTIAYLTWRITLPWRWRAWYVAPSFFAAALCLILLPMDYGVLKRDLNYPRIALTLDKKLPVPVPGRLFLLRQRANDFVVWDASICKLFWIPASSVKRAEVNGTDDLLNPAQCSYPTHGEKK